MFLNSKLHVFVVPDPKDFPRQGGVREHLIQLYKQIGRNPKTELATHIDDADVLHIESSYSIPLNGRRSRLYVCHGGFVPEPIPAVLENLKHSRAIVSVAQWVADKYFPQYKHKTVVIPNGVDLDEWKDLPPSGIEPGYILYAKEWPYFMEDFIRLAELMPKQRFVSTVWPKGMKQLANVEVIGNQDRIVIRSVLNDAAVLMLTGSEVCPTMLLEAWACKTPVIAKMIDGSAELLRTYIPMDDYGGMAKGIQGGAGYHTKLDDDMSVGFIEHVLSKAEELGEQGYEQVVAHYQWKDLFERYVRLYEAVKFDEVAQFIQDHAGEGSTEEVG